MAPAISAPTPSPDEREQALRFHVVGLVHAMEARGMTRAAAVAEAARTEHLLPDGTTRLVSSRSVYRYLAAFERGGLSALTPQPRARIATSTVLPAAFVGWLAAEMPKDPAASIPEMIRRAVAQGIVPSAGAIDRSTVYRAARRMGLPVARRRRAAPPRDDQRRFAYPHRMQMVLCDGKQFRVGPHRARRVALTFFDDATRMVLHTVVGVGTGEPSELFLRGLFELTCRYGLADAYYVDNGSGFIALDSIHVVTRELGRPLIHGRARYPEGRGKLERYHRTMKADLLRGWDRAAGVDPDAAALELRLRHYVDRQYNIRPHKALGEGRSPADAFDADPRALALPDEAHEQLAARFVVYLERTVNGDHTVPVDGTDYELPPGHARTVVRLHRRVLDGSLWLPRQSEGPLRLHPVDPTHNARARRRRRRAAAEETPPARPSAADLAFERDHGPVVDPDGGCPRTDDTPDTPFDQEN